MLKRICAIVSAFLIFFSCVNEPELDPVDEVYILPECEMSLGEWYEIHDPPDQFVVEYHYSSRGETACCKIFFPDSSVWQIDNYYAGEYNPDVHGNLEVDLDVRDIGVYSEVLLCRGWPKICEKEGAFFGVRPGTAYEFYFLDYDDKIKSAQFRFSKNTMDYDSADLQL